MDFSKMRTPDWIMGGCGLVLIIDLLFFPWHKIDFGSFGGGSVNRSAVESPNSGWGWLALLLTIAIVAVVVLRRLTTVQLPEIPVPYQDAAFFASIAVAAILLLKLVIETDFLGFGSYFGIILAGGMTYGAFAARQLDGSAASTTPPTAF